MPTTSKQAKKTAREKLAKDPAFYSRLGKKSAESEKHHSFTSLAARRASWKRWHPDEPLPVELQG